MNSFVDGETLEHHMHTVFVSGIQDVIVIGAAGYIQASMRDGEVTL